MGCQAAGAEVCNYFSDRRVYPIGKKYKKIRFSDLVKKMQKVQGQFFAVTLALLSWKMAKEVKVKRQS